MINFRDKESVREVMDNGLSSIQTILSYLLLPIALPFVFFQECLAWFRERFGLNNRSMEGKVVLITGASSGIGETLAHTFFNHGCRLILASRRMNELERVKDDLVRRKLSGSRVHIPAILEMDLGDLKALPAKAKAALAIYGGIDILVNNAGILHSAHVLETDVEVDKKIMDVNYFGALALTKVIGNNMKDKKSGHIVFLSSVSGRIASPHSSAYCASKHAMQALADSLRAEVADDGIEVTTISPSFVKTNISMNALTGKGSLLKRMTNNVRNGLSPEYVAERVFKAVQNREKDLIISPILPKAAIFMRYLTPNFLFFLMKLRARRYKNRGTQ